MTIIQDIYKWPQDLASWKQNAIRRLYFYWMLSSGDLDDLVVMAKSPEGIEDSVNRISLELEDSDLAVALAPVSLVQVSVTKNLVNVSALAKAQSLIIGHIGLTLIFGEKSSAKAGYPKTSEDDCVPS